MLEFFVWVYITFIGRFFFFTNFLFDVLVWRLMDKNQLAVNTKHDFQNPTDVYSNMTIVNWTIWWWGMCKSEILFCQQTWVICRWWWSRTSEPECCQVRGCCYCDEGWIYVIPRAAMEFETKDHAYKCYNRYAVLTGFIISEKVVKSPHYKLWLS